MIAPISHRSQFSLVRFADTTVFHDVSVRLASQSDPTFTFCLVHTGSFRYHVSFQVVFGQVVEFLCNDFPHPIMISIFSIFFSVFILLFLYPIFE